MNTSFEFDLFKFVSDFVLRISSLPTRLGVRIK